LRAEKENWGVGLGYIGKKGKKKTWKKCEKLAKNAKKRKKVREIVPKCAKRVPFCTSFELFVVDCCHEGPKTRRE